MPIPVTALYGSLNALLNIFLAWRVSNTRRAEKVGLGMNDSHELLVRVRTHSNNAEFVPLAIVMLLIAEISGGASVWLHVIGGSVLVARILHAIGMPRKAPNPPRFIGTAVTWSVITGTAIWVLWMRFKG